MEDWNRDSFQGKRKDQVQFSKSVVVFSTIIIVILVLIAGVYKICSII